MKLDMKFELNDYHRNLSDDELIEDMKMVARTLGKDTLTKKEYTVHGKYHPSTIEKRFGTWKKGLESSGLESKLHYIPSDEEVINDLKQVAAVCGKGTITREEYSSFGKFSSSTLERNYGSWNATLKLAGMELNLNRNFTNEEMFEDIEKVWIMLGRQPTTTDIKKGISKYSLQSYARRFGGWRDALQAFVNYINSYRGDENDELQMQEYHHESPIERMPIQKTISASRRTNRVLI